MPENPPTADPAGSGAPVAVVTGAAQGLGAQIADRLARRGYLVVATDVQVTPTDGVGSAGAASTGGAGSVERAHLDVRDGAACTALAAEVASRHGGLDVWVNNAGVLATGPGWELLAERIRQVIEVNVLGTIAGTLAALSQMRPRGRGAVLNIVSLAGLGPVPGMAAYSASKHAALAFSMSTLGELRAAGERNITISCLCPAGIWTPMLHERTGDPWAALSFGGRLLAAEAVADRAMALLDRPRPVAAMPRVMGPLSRLTSAVPGPTMAAAPLLLRVARWQQRRQARRLTGE